MSESKRAGESPEKWYSRTPWIIVLLLAFWPVGLVLMWRSGWPVIVKVLASAFVAVSVYVIWDANQAVVAALP